MSYNGSGTFNINTTGQPVVTGTVISSTAFNALTADLGTGLSTAITKDGQTVATARIPFAQGINSSLVTDATNTTTGSIITAGGVGIAKALFVGTTANIAGTTTLAGVTATSITDSGLTSGRVTYAGTAGLLQDSANLTFNGTTLTANTIGAFTLGGTVAGGGNQLNNVIIGTTNPLAGAFTTLSATGVIGTAASGTAAAPSISIYDAGTGGFYRPTTNQIGVACAGANVATFSSTGLAVTGTLSATTTGQVGTTLGVGAATPSASGSGITFPATQSASTDANTLDDYEEGTWTPILAATGGGTATYSAQVGRYRKIGSFVCVWARVDLATVGSLSGLIVVASLPFTSQNATNYLNTGTILLENTVFVGSPISFINPNDTNAYIASSVSGAGASFLNATGLTSSTTVTITICYHTN